VPQNLPIKGAESYPPFLKCKKYEIAI